MSLNIDADMISAFAVTVLGAVLQWVAHWLHTPRAVGLGPTPGAVCGVCMFSMSACALRCTGMPVVCLPAQCPALPGMDARLNITLLWISIMEA